MKLVIYTRHYGYEVPHEVMKELGITNPYDGSVGVRSSKAFIDWVKNSETEFYGIVNIPQAATDFRIQEYDGLESVIYVLNGKIVDAKVKVNKKEP